MLYNYSYEKFVEEKNMKSCFSLLFISLSVSILQVKTQDSDITCTLGRTDLEETSAIPTPGLFIDLDNPATCSGQVLQWRLCYYNPSNFHSERDLTIGLQVWRFDQQQRRGSLVGQNILVVTIPIPDELENFQCITLDPPADGPPLNITQGDLLGVTLKQDSVLPVVAAAPNQSPAPRMLFTQPSVLTVTEVDLDDSVSVQVTSVLHLTAEIGVAIQAGVPITSFTTTTVTPETQMTHDTQTEDTTGTDEHLEESAVHVAIISGAVAGVVCVLLIVILVTALALCVRRRKGQQNSHCQDEDIETTPNIAYEASIGKALELKENVAYATTSNFEMGCNMAYASPSNFKMASNVAYASALDFEMGPNVAYVSTLNTDREVTAYATLLNFEMDCNVAYASSSNIEMGSNVAYTSNTDREVTALELKENVAYATLSNFEMDCNAAYAPPSNFEMGSNVAYASASNTDREVTEYDYVL